MKRICVLCALLFLVSSLITAQAVVPDSTYRQVDDIMTRQAIPELNAFLSKSLSQAWYPRLESYLLKRSRQLIIENKLDDAKAATLALIDANLDNKEAVDLYQSVQSAIKKRDADAKKTAEQESLAAYKQTAAENKIRQELPKTYKTATNATTGKKVYLDQDFNTHYRTWNWDFVFGLANLNYISAPSGSELKYGLSASGSAYFIGDTFCVGVDVLGDAMPLSLSGTKSLDWSGGGILSLALTSFSRYAVLRTGYMGFGYDYGNPDIDPVLFLTPVAGIGLRDVLIGESSRLAWALDYYPGHLSQGDMQLAFGTQLLMTFILADMQDFSIHFQTGIRDTVLLYNDGLKNDAKVVLAIGIGDYE